MSEVHTYEKSELLHCPAHGTEDEQNIWFVIPLRWSLKYLKVLYWRCLKVLYRKIISSWFFIFLKYYFIFIFL